MFSINFYNKLYESNVSLPLGWTRYHYSTAVGSILFVCFLLNQTIFFTAVFLQHRIRLTIKWISVQFPLSGVVPQSFLVLHDVDFFLLNSLYPIPFLNRMLLFFVYLSDTSLGLGSGYTFPAGIQHKWCCVLLKVSNSEVHWIYLSLFLNLILITSSRLHPIPLLYSFLFILIRDLWGRFFKIKNKYCPL